MLKGCCCFRLNTAGLIIGWIYTIFSFLLVIASFIRLINFEKDDEFVQEIDSNSKESIEIQKKVWLLVNSLSLAVNLINVVLSALLIVGAMKKRPSFLVPWLVINGLSQLIFCIVILLVAIIFSPIAVYSYPVVGFNFYLWYVVYSLFKEMQANRDDNKQSLMPYNNFK